LFAFRVRQFVKRLPKSICNQNDVTQVVRSSGSIAANYIEANESLSKRDFKHRLRIARKESKESRLWLRLLDTNHDDSLENERQTLLKECEEVRRILSAILLKSE
jgi:four helix bundle protein